jgi:hypothetical protein
MQQRAWPDAERAARRALSALPDESSLHLALARALSQQGRDEDAADVLRHRLTARSDPAARAMLAQLEVSLKSVAGLSHRASSHFNVRFEGQGDDALGRSLVETLEEKHAMLARTLEFELTQLIPITLYPNQLFKSTSTAPSWAGGYFSHGDGRIRIGTRDLSAGFVPLDLERTLTHELTHAFVFGLTRGAISSDVNEGLAQYLSCRRLGYRLDPGRVAGSGERVKVDDYYDSALRRVPYRPLPPIGDERPPQARRRDGQRRQGLQARLPPGVPRDAPGVDQEPAHPLIARSVLRSAPLNGEEALHVKSMVQVAVVTAGSASAGPPNGSAPKPAAPASAWIVRTRIDPINDSKTRSASQANASVLLMFICSEGRPGALVSLVNHAGVLNNYAGRATVSFRLDGDPAIGADAFGISVNDDLTAGVVTDSDVANLLFTAALGGVRLKIDVYGSGYATPHYSAAGLAGAGLTCFTPDVAAYDARIKGLLDTPDASEHPVDARTSSTPELIKNRCASAKDPELCARLLAAKATPTPAPAPTPQKTRDEILEGIIKECSTATDPAACERVLSAKLRPRQ